MRTFLNLPVGLKLAASALVAMLMLGGIVLAQRNPSARPVPGHAETQA